MSHILHKRRNIKRSVMAVPGWWWQRGSLGHANDRQNSCGLKQGMRNHWAFQRDHGSLQPFVALINELFMQVYSILLNKKYTSQWTSIWSLPKSAVACLPQHMHKHVQYWTCTSWMKSELIIHVANFSLSLFTFTVHHKYSLQSLNA